MRIRKACRIGLSSGDHDCLLLKRRLTTSLDIDIRGSSYLDIIGSISYLCFSNTTRNLTGSLLFILFISRGGTRERTSSMQMDIVDSVFHAKISPTRRGVVEKAFPTGNAQHPLTSRIIPIGCSARHCIPIRSRGAFPIMLTEVLSALIRYSFW